MAKPLPITEALKLPPRGVVILATPSAQSLEVAGPVEVFAMAAVKLHEAGRERMSGYVVEVVSATNDLTIRSSSGLTILAQRPWRDIDYEIDTLLVAGGMEIWTGEGQKDLLAWIRKWVTSTFRLDLHRGVCPG